MSHEDFRATVLIEVAEQNIARSKADRHPHARLERAVADPEKDMNAVVELRPVAVHDVQLAIAIHVNDGDAGGIAARGVNGARVKGSVAAV